MAEEAQRCGEAAAAEEIGDCLRIREHRAIEGLWRYRCHPQAEAAVEEKVALASVKKHVDGTWAG